MIRNDIGLYFIFINILEEFYDISVSNSHEISSFIQKKFSRKKTFYPNISPSEKEHLIKVLCFLDIVVCDKISVLNAYMTASGKVFFYEVISTTSGINSNTNNSFFDVHIFLCLLLVFMQTYFVTSRLPSSMFFFRCGCYRELLQCTSPWSFHEGDGSKG